MRTVILHFEIVYFRLIQNHYLLLIIHEHLYTSLYNIWNIYDTTFVEGDQTVGQQILSLITIGKAITNQ
jgi:hypothetical protein